MILFNDSKFFWCNFQQTGVKERCIFNELDGFHVIKNVSFDMMHDVLEGVGSYDMSDIILSLILEHKCITIETLNRIIRSANLGFESSSRIPEINLNYLKLNSKMKMSSSEVLLLIRYFGVLIGTYVKPDWKCWRLYYLLRKIIHIMTSPRLHKCDLVELDRLIFLHNKLYVEEYGPLRPKHHLLLHYPGLILRTGPLVQSWNMRTEAKHRDIKKALITSACKKNILLTAAKRQQLSLIAFKRSAYDKTDFTTMIYFKNAVNSVTLSYVTANNLTCKKGTIILTKFEDNEFYFGWIDKVYLIDGKIQFCFLPLKVVGFNKHFFAYSVDFIDDRQIIAYKDLLIREPFLLFKIDKYDYIVPLYCFLIAI